MGKIKKLYLTKGH